VERGVLGEKHNMLAALSNDLRDYTKRSNILFGVLLIFAAGLFLYAAHALTEIKFRQPYNEF
jgi:hypothetical protein